MAKSGWTPFRQKTTQAPKSNASKYMGATPAKPVSSYTSNPAKPGQSAVTNKPANMDAYRMVQADNPGVAWRDVRAWVDSGMGGPAQAANPPPRLPGNGAGSGSGGGGRGGRGGGGGVNPAVAAQAQMDYLASLLGSGAYTYTATPFDQSPYDQMRTTVTENTALDQAAATGAYNNLDTWLAQNQRNPYADVRLQAAQRAPSQNPYLASQGVAPLAEPASNPEDTGMGAFQNVLALLGANQQANQQSRAAESQMGRTFAGQQIGAMDNAYLANIGNRQTQAQQAWQQQQMQIEQQRAEEKRQALLQLAALIGQGAKAPDLAALGLA